MRADFTPALRGFLEQAAQVQGIEYLLDILGLRELLERIVHDYRERQRRCPSAPVAHDRRAVRAERERARQSAEVLLLVHELDDYLLGFRRVRPAALHRMRHPLHLAQLPFGQDLVRKVRDTLVLDGTEILLAAAVARARFEAREPVIALGLVQFALLAQHRPLDEVVAVRRFEDARQVYLPQAPFLQSNKRGFHPAHLSGGRARYSLPAAPSPPLQARALRA